MNVCMYCSSYDCSNSSKEGREHDNCQVKGGEGEDYSNTVFIQIEATPWIVAALSRSLIRGKNMTEDGLGLVLLQCGSLILRRLHLDYSKYSLCKSAFYATIFVDYTIKYGPKLIKAALKEEPPSISSQGWN